MRFSTKQGGIIHLLPLFILFILVMAIVIFLASLATTSPQGLFATEYPQTTASPTPDDTGY